MPPIRRPHTTTYGDLLGRMQILRNPQAVPEGETNIYDRALNGTVMLAIRRFVREAGEQLKDFESARDTLFQEHGWTPQSGEAPPEELMEPFNELVAQEVTFDVTAIPEAEFADGGLTLRELDILEPIIHYEQEE